ncbi:PREDICTED: mitochondrial cardiolipin hydrolase [Gekko japonicus]|uniref:Mitochondrial cardiolipin hydrolase n=1 Tax=Gekko japonicus TaxID=146911 RepID=A0ABM1LAY5_GEKJA|nr:PREDICTED: mitochondrial cardiolipin hydrolase [Gekko japonicus]
MAIAPVRSHTPPQLYAPISEGKEREKPLAVEGAGGRMALWRGGAFVSLAVALAVTLEALAEWLVRRRQRREAREVLFFPAGITCVERLLAAAEREAEGVEGVGLFPPRCSCPLPHEDEGPFGRLLGRLLGARPSLQLCLFAFSSPQLCRAVLVLHRRGVRIRVVTDADYMALRGSQIGILRRAGIQVRHDQDSGYMHHKFAIIDKRLLLTGSLNWTTQAIQQNRENVLILEDAEYVKLFLKEFEKIWENYNPANYIFFSKEEVPKKDKHKPETERQFNK